MHSGTRLLSNRFQVTIVNWPIAGMSAEFSVIPGYAISGPEQAISVLNFLSMMQVEEGIYTAPNSAHDYSARGDEYTEDLCSTTR